MITAGLSLLACAGCDSHPSPVKPVRIDPGDAKSGAIEQYDKDGDGALNDAELAAVPGILKYKSQYDLDGDGVVSGDEIADRVKVWQKDGVGIRGLKVTVLLGSRPLQGAQVRFVPEPYMGDGPKVGTGTTNASGVASVSVAPEFLPEDLRVARVRGLFQGTYKIEVTHPKQTIASRFNTATTLGEEIARDTLGDHVVLRVERN